MYPLELVQPMKNDLTQVGFKELLNAKEVDEAISSSKGTMLLVVNSVCGCAAGNMRPGVKKSLTHTNIPQALYTVFAGVDAEAVNQARQYFYPILRRHHALPFFTKDRWFIFLNDTILKGPQQI